MKKPIPQQLIAKPFSTRDAVARGLSKATLTRMVQAGTLDRVSHGVYQASNRNENSEDTYRAAVLRCGSPSAICLMSALEHHHLTDQITKQTWILVPESKRILSKDLRLIRSRNPQWTIGIQKADGYWMTGIERTLIDCLICRKLVGSQVAIAAIKQALAQKKVKLGVLYDMAKKMGVDHRIRPTIEALAA